jgi:hypothetical protein
MLHKGLDFHTVRILCKGCGWYRNIAHSGCADGKRALVRITKSADPSHILHAQVIEVLESRPLEEVLSENPEYRDLVEEAHKKGLIAMERELFVLLYDAVCPRCKNMGNLELSQLWNLGSHVRY